MYWVLVSNFSSSRTWVGSPSQVDSKQVYIKKVLSVWEALDLYMTQTFTSGTPLNAEKAQMFFNMAVEERQLYTDRYLKGRVKERYEDEVRDFLDQVMYVFPPKNEGCDWRPTETVPEDYYAL